MSATKRWYWDDLMNEARLLPGSMKKQEVWNGLYRDVPDEDGQRQAADDAQLLDA